MLQLLYEKRKKKWNGWTELCFILHNDGSCESEFLRIRTNFFLPFFLELRFILHYNVLILFIANCESEFLRMRTNFEMPFVLLMLAVHWLWWREEQFQLCQQEKLCWIPCSSQFHNIIRPINQCHLNACEVVPSVFLHSSRQKNIIYWVGLEEGCWQKPENRSKSNW